MSTTVRFLFSLILLTACSSCNSQSKSDYANDLNDCLSAEDVTLLNEACMTFEKQLTVRYPETEVAKVYRAYLIDLQAMKVPPSFLTSAESKKMIARLKSTKTFDKVWVKLADLAGDELLPIPPINGEAVPQPKAKPQGFCINPNGALLLCLINKSKNKSFKEYLNTLKEMPDISPGLTSGLLAESLKSEDYNNNLIKLTIAVNFYYELAMFLEKK